MNNNNGCLLLQTTSLLNTSKNNLGLLAEKRYRFFLTIHGAA